MYDIVKPRIVTVHTLIKRKKNGSYTLTNITRNKNIRTYECKNMARSTCQNYCQKKSTQSPICKANKGIAGQLTICVLGYAACLTANVADSQGQATFLA